MSTHSSCSQQQQEQHSSGMDLKQHGSVAENHHQHNEGCPPLQQKQSQANCPQRPAEQPPNQILQTTGMQISEKNPTQTHEPERMHNQDGKSQYSKVQKMGNQPVVGTELVSNAISRGREVPFAILLPALTPHLDKDRAMQLHALYGKLKKKKIVKDVFVRRMRRIVGNQMLRLAVTQLQSQMGANQFQLQSKASARQQSDSVFSQGKEGNHDPNQPISQWQNASQDENTNFQGLESAQQQEQHSSGLDLKQHGSVAENQHQHNDGCPPLQQKQSQDNCPQRPAEQTPNQILQTTGMQISEKNLTQTHEPERMHNQDGESQYSKVQKMGNQPVVGAELVSNAISRGREVPFAILLPALTPHLDKDRAMQLHALYGKLKKKKIVKDVFVRRMRRIVGDQMLRLAVTQLQSQMVANQFQLQSQASARQQQLRMPSVGAGATQFTDPHSFPQLHQKSSNFCSDPAHVPASSALAHGSSFPIKENRAQKSRELERQPGSHRMHVNQISSSSSSTTNQERERTSVPVQGLNKQQQLHYPQTSFPMYGSSGGNYHPFTGTNVNPMGSSPKPQPHDSQMRQITHHQSMGSTPPGGVPKQSSQKAALAPQQARESAERREARIIASMQNELDELKKAKQEFEAKHAGCDRQIKHLEDTVGKLEAAARGHEKMAASDRRKKEEAKAKAQQLKANLQRSRDEVKTLTESFDHSKKYIAYLTFQLQAEIEKSEGTKKDLEEVTIAMKSVAERDVDLLVSNNELMKD